MTDYQQYNYPPTSTPPPAPPKLTAAPATIAALLVVSAIGFILSQQGTSVAQGSSTIWLGFIISGAVAVAGFFVTGLPTWVKVVLVVVAVLALGSAIYVEYELAQRRREIQDILNHLPAITSP